MMKFDDKTSATRALIRWFVSQGITQSESVSIMCGLIGVITLTALTKKKKIKGHVRKLAVRIRGGKIVKMWVDCG